jgi:hypothetical protein
MCGKVTNDSFPDYSASPGGVPPSFVVTPPAVTAKDVLRLARETIKDAKHWVKGSYKTYRYDYAQTYPCYCSIGAVYEAADKLGVSRHSGVAYDAIQCLANVSPLKDDDSFGTEGKVTVFNDKVDTTHAEVLGLFFAAEATCQISSGPADVA